MSVTYDRDWPALEQQYYQSLFTRQPLTLVRGEGVHVWDSEGRRYLDLVAGIAVNVLGHCHPAIVTAVQQQVTQIVHVSNLYYNIPQIELAELLSQQSAGMRAFFCNSGGEANEAAIKLARKYGRLHRDGAYEIISMDHGFHGRTLATTAATGKPAYHATWAPLPDGFKQVPLNDLAALKATTSDKTVGVLIEPVQGEGGVWPADPAFLQGVRQWCDEQNLVLIFDEIQSGMGRTGTFFCWEQTVTPDIVTMAKGLGGGLPIGAMLTGPRTDLFVPGDHGSTFGGNPIACAAGVATIRTIREQELVKNASRLGEAWQQILLALCEKYPALISQPRGLGLMRALHVEHGLAPQIVQYAQQQGLLLNATSSDTLRMVPPLVLTSEDLLEAAELFDCALATLAAHTNL